MNPCLGSSQFKWFKPLSLPQITISSTQTDLVTVFAMIWEPYNTTHCVKAAKTPHKEPEAAF